MVRPINYVWNYFDKQVQNGVKYGVCKSCQDALKMTDGSTGSIRHHLKTRHTSQFAEMQRLQAEAQRQKTDELLEVAEAQSQLNVAKGKNYTFNRFMFIFSMIFRTFSVIFAYF